MADVTIQQLSYALPSSAAVIPFSDKGVTSVTSPSGLYSGNVPLLVNFSNTLSGLSAFYDPKINPAAAGAKIPEDIRALIYGGWLLCVSDKNMSWGDSAARIGVKRMGAGDEWWFSHNLDGSCGIHQSRYGDRIRILSGGAVTFNAQPGFKASINNQSQGSGETIIWDYLVNEMPGGSFNTSTGVWTVPVTGKYLIIVNLISERNTAAGDWYVDIIVNNNEVPVGSRLYTSKAGNANAHAQLNSSLIVNLNKNDTVHTRLLSSVGKVSPSVLHNQFSAHLLG